jgi:hypothetical protein
LSTLTSATVSSRDAQLGSVLLEEVLHRRRAELADVGSAGAQEALDVGAHLRRRRVAIFATKRDRPPADRVDLHRHVRKKLAWGGRVVARVERVGDGNVVALAPELASRRHVPEKHAGGEDVRTSIRVAARRLLGRHVPDLALDDPALRLRRAAGRLRDPEVDDLHRTVVRHEHVVRGDVAVHDVQRCSVVVGELVRMVQPREHIGDDGVEHLAREVRSEAAHALHHAVHGLALEELHREEVLAALVAELEELDHVRVREPRGDARLVHEHRDELGILGEVAPELLDDRELREARSDRPLDGGEEHVGHAAVSQLGDQPIRAEGAGVVGHEPP